MIHAPENTNKKEVYAMKTVVLAVNDNSKFHLLVNFLRDARFIEMKDNIASV
uniref:Uncharacterized protein n=1 Tax=Candidatus Kentrum sp. MB TaxID=2138164 RepID=A0A450XD22_9GAMM|nr:MAG: hypothetical protein BECKMB1821G_GA0114241_101622 [Candidatus Kentron sp. MB]VFK27192.1 MAG: hypothetical protein BECKMB1821I_GA0114274_100273 [Candidatus Kentron sp. MB]VFK75085.1 MAG: hypothetical protein BECKMB1821H_GA0114242_101522 [Candidatus Kentron sp. MB]